VCCACVARSVERAIEHYTRGNTRIVFDILMRTLVDLEADREAWRRGALILGRLAVTAMQAGPAELAELRELFCGRLERELAELGELR
jgi:hypothetical protein